MVGRLILVGVGAAIVANATQALGLVFQRKAECIELSMSRMREGCGKRRDIYWNKMWQIGFMLFLLANLLGATIQIATLPLIVLAPLQASGLVFNSLFSHVLLDEPFPFIPTFLVCSGGTIMASMACMFINTPVSHSYAELVELARDQRFLIYFVASNGFGIILVLTSVLVRKGKIKGLLLLFTSGMWSAHALLIAKCLSDVITEEWSFSYHTVFLFSALVSFALTQLFLLNRALSHLSTAILYPFVFSVYNMCTVLNSTMFYHDSLVPHTAQFLYPGLLFGFLVLSLGVVSVSMALQQAEESFVHDLKPMSSNSVALSYGSINHGRPLSDEFTAQTNTYTSLSV